ncbi:hypothetical protein MTO96_010717 [Rhipicephalus appendiculatus]
MNEELRIRSSAESIRRRIQTAAAKSSARQSPARLSSTATRYPVPPLMTETSENASSPITTVVTTTLGYLTSNASATPDSTLASSSTATAITAEPSSKVTSQDSNSGTRTTTVGQVTSREGRALSLNATRTTGSTDKRASQGTTLPKRATSTSVSSSAQSKSSRKPSARSSVAPKTAYLVIDSDGPKEEMQMWPQMVRELEAPEKGNVPPASKMGSEEPAGGLWYYIESIGGNSTSDGMDDEVFGEGDNTESPHPPGS